MQINSNQKLRYYKSLLELRNNIEIKCLIARKTQKGRSIKIPTFQIRFQSKLLKLGFREIIIQINYIIRFIEKGLPKVNEVQIQSNRVQKVVNNQYNHNKLIKNIQSNIEFQNEVRSAKERLRLLEKYRRQQLQLKDQFSKSPLQKSPLSQIPPTMTEHEKRKNDEHLSSSVDD